jgi:aldehyde dehydrogenase (NAD+)
MNAGQACVAPDYVLVHTDLQTQLLSKVTQYIKQFWNNGHNQADYGRIIHEGHA